MMVKDGVGEWQTHHLRLLHLHSPGQPPLAWPLVNGFHLEQCYFYHSVLRDRQTQSLGSSSRLW